MRETFAYICSLGKVSDALQLWTKYSAHMTLDYTRNLNEEEANNAALNDINAILIQHGSSCDKIGLPTPINFIELEERCNIQAEKEKADIQIAMLNSQQLDAFNFIKSFKLLILMMMLF